MVLLHYNQAIVVQLLSHVLTPCMPGSLSSPSPGTCSDSRPLSWWCYLTISSSAPPSPFAFSINQVGYLNSLSLHLLIHESIIEKHLIGVFMNIKRKCMRKNFCTFLHSVDAQCIMITIIVFWVAADTQVSGNPSINSWEIFNDCF